MKNKLVAGAFVRRMAKSLLSLTLLAGVLAACSGGEDTSADTRVLRIGVLYGSADNESYFRQQYTDTYELMHPNIEFEIVNAIDYNDTRWNTPDPNGQSTQPDPYEELKKMLTGDNPVDVVVFNYNYLKRLTQDNLLKQLDPLITQDKFDISDYVPTVIDGIKAAGDNNIYALTPTFSSSALYYNKTLFSEAGVDLPTDGMTWDQVFEKARLLAKGEGGDRIFGMTMNRWGSDGYYDMQTYSAPLGLKIWDDKVETMTVNEPGWQAVWETMTGLYKDHVLPSQEDMQAVYEKMNKQSADGGYSYNPLGNDLFLGSRVAMTIGEFNYTNEIKSAMDNASKIQDFKPFEWDVVTMPTHSSAPGIGNVYLSDLMAINAGAQNADDAWDFIKFSNSKEWAELKSRSMYELSARKEFIKPRDGLSFNINAFTTLKPIPPSSTDKEKQYRDYPRLYEVEQPANELFQQVLQGTKTVPEALKEWETKGNQILTDIKNNPTGGGDGGIAVPLK